MRMQNRLQASKPSIKMAELCNYKANCWEVGGSKKAKNRKGNIKQVNLKTQSRNVVKNSSKQEC